MGDIYTNAPDSRNGEILESIIQDEPYTLQPQSRIEELLIELKTVIDNCLTNYYTKSEVYTKTEVNNIAQARFQVVQELPSSDIKTNVIYLVPKSSAQASNDYDEYIYALKSTNPDTYGWEKIGDTEIDLSGYVTTSELNEIITYSTSEHQVGTWIDGKTIYRKTISRSNIATSSAEVIQIPHGISNLDKIIDLEIQMSTTEQAYIGGVVTGWVGSAWCTSTDLNVQVHGNWGAKPEREWHFTMTYTKTS